MFNFLFRTPAWQLIAQADVMTKFVLLFLFSLSVFCIWIVLNKFLAFKKEKKAMKLLQIKMREVKTFDDLLAIGKEFKDFAGGRFLINSFGELKDILSEDKTISRSDIEHFQLLLDKSLTEVLSEQEEYLPVLGTSASASPLIGLFGTIWGLVHAFVDISKNKSADISVVAPGIAEALTTTLAGLIVAIPALIFFHYFSNEIRKLEQQLINLSDRFLNIARKTFLK